MQENSEFQEKKEPEESDFKSPGELETGYTEKAWKKPEKTMEEKGTTMDSEYQEREEPAASECQSPGEQDTGYTQRS